MISKEIYSKSINGQKNDPEIESFKKLVSIAESIVRTEEFSEETKVKPLTVFCDYCFKHFDFNHKEFLTEHQRNDCLDIVITCTIGCGNRFTRRELPNHLANECSKRYVTCCFCNDNTIWSEDLKSHQSEICLYRPYDCLLLCGIKGLTFCSEENHRINECNRRLITCVCNQTMEIQQHKDHLTFDCPEKLSLCPQGCGLTMKDDKIKDHIKYSCKNKLFYYQRVTTCPIGCGESMTLQEVIDHVSYSCQKRLSDCPLGCGDTLRFHKMRSHLFFCPNRIICCEPNMKPCENMFYKWFYFDPFEQTSIVNNSKSKNGRAATAPEIKNILIKKSSPRLPMVSNHFESSQSSPNSTRGNFEGSSKFFSSKSLETTNKVNEYYDPFDKSIPISQDKLQSTSSVKVDAELRIFFRFPLRMAVCKRHGMSALMAAIKYDEFSMAQYIVKQTQGMDLDIENSSGHTALTLAVRLGKINFVELLIQYGAHVNKETHSGRTALIEACRTPVENTAVVELLIKSSAIVRYKSIKHKRSALDWARLMKYGDSYRILELGGIVQSQICMLFKYISIGDFDKLKELIEIGDKFDANNEYHAYTNMEEHIIFVRKGNSDIRNIRNHLNDISIAITNHMKSIDECNYKINKYINKQTELLNHQDIMNKQLSQYILKYESIANQLIRSDLDEITNLHNFNNYKFHLIDSPIKISVYIYGLLFHILKIDDWINFDIISSISNHALTLDSNDFDYKKLWSILHIQFEDPRIYDTLRKINGFSFERFYHLHDNNQLIAKLRSIYMHLSQIVGIGVENSSIQSNVFVSNDANINENTEAEAKEIEDADWDSDADEAGDGYWLKGEWIPIQKSRKNWWEKSSGDDKVIGSIHSRPVSRKEKYPIVRVTAINETANKDTNSDIISNLWPFVQSMYVLLQAIYEISSQSIYLTNIKKDLSNLLTLLENENQIKQSINDELHSNISKRNHLEIELVETIKNTKFLLEKTKTYREKLRVIRLLNFITESGHTALSWACSYGAYDMVEILLNHGGTIGFTADLMHLSASCIQLAYRLYKYKFPDSVVSKLFLMKSNPLLMIANVKKERRILNRDENKNIVDVNIYEKMEKIDKKLEIIQILEKNINTDTNLLLDSNNDDDNKSNNDQEIDRTNNDNIITDIDDNKLLPYENNNMTLLIEEIFQTKERLLSIQNNIQILRQRLRFPIPEALYTGHYEIIQRIYKKKLFHHNFISTWMYPSPPTPFLPKQLNSFGMKRPKLSFLEILSLGMNDIAAGIYTVDKGWVGPNDPEDVFGESYNEMMKLYNDESDKIRKFREERKRIRMISRAVKLQKSGGEEMIDAIINRDVRKCMTLAQYYSVSIDSETMDRDGSYLTPLIMASDENVVATNHAYMINDDNQPCLQVEYLLDRFDYRPTIDIESKDGYTALIKASSLNRYHVVEALLDRGSNVNHVNKTGRTALHYAVEVGSSECTRILLERGATSEIKDNNNCTPYDIADDWGFLHIMKLLSQFKSGYLGVIRKKRGRVYETESCPYGCGKHLLISLLKDHINSCDYRIVPCSNGCNEKRIQAQELSNHVITTCTHRSIQCRDCRVTYRLCDEYIHQSNECTNRLVQCTYQCGEVMKYSKLKNHLKLCNRRIVACPLHCEVTMTVSDSYYHVKNTCEHRKIACPLKCTELIMFKHLNDHVHSSCINRDVRCNLCGTLNQWKDLKDHNKSCEFRIVECDNKCGQKMNIKLLSTHMNEHCINRFVKCKFNCLYKLRYCDMEKHCMNECGNRIITCPNLCPETNTIPIAEPCSDPVITFDGKPVTKLYAKQLDIHLKHACPYRYTNCQLCSLSIYLPELSKHQSYECDRRMVPCQNTGCLKTLPLDEREQHEHYKCRFRYVPCSQGCGESILYLHTGKHNINDCMMRYVDCPLLCGEMIRFKYMNDHVKYSCSRKTK